MLKLFKRIWCRANHSNLTWPRGGISRCNICLTEFYNPGFDIVDNYYERKGIRR